MTMSTELRISKSKSEIRSVLKNVFKESKEITLWQNIDGKRKVFTTQIKDIKIENNAILLTPFPSQEEFDFHAKTTIYFRTEFKGVLFKEVSQMTGSKMVILPIPEEIRIIEYRENPRGKFKISGDSKVKLHPIESDGQLERTFEFKLLDLSNTGAGLIVNLNQGHLLSSGDKVAISSLNNKSIGTIIYGTVVYLRKVKFNLKFKTIIGFRVGVHFDHKINAKDYF